MKYAGLILICAVLGSCLNDGNCLITATNNIHIQFKKLSDHKDSTIILDTIYISGTDTVVIYNVAATEALIPIDIHSNVTSIVIRHTNADTTKLGSDTLQVSYTAQTKVIAKDCGAFTYYQNLEIVKTNLKESQIKVFNTSLLKDPTVGNTPSAYAVNYQIFY